MADTANEMAAKVNVVRDTGSKFGISEGRLRRGGMGLAMKSATIAMAFLAVASSALAQSMNGWTRIPDEQLKFEKDHAYCSTTSVRVPSGPGPLGLPPPTKPSLRPSTAPELEKCMRERGWEKSKP